MKRLIAIVEDEPAIRDNYTAAFQRHGYSVRPYGSRKEAIEAFRARLPDLAVIDVGLKDEPEGGFELVPGPRWGAGALPFLFPPRGKREFECVAGLAPGRRRLLEKS